MEYEEKWKTIKGKDSKAKKEDKDNDKDMDIQKEDGNNSAEGDNVEREKEAKVSCPEHKLNITGKFTEFYPKINAVTGNGSTPSIECIPRIYALQKYFHLTAWNCASPPS